MMNKFKQMVTATAFVLTGVLLVSCGPQDERKEFTMKKPVVKKETHINLCFTEGYKSIDPGTSVSIYDTYYTQMIFDSLLGFKQGTALIEPRLAESFESLEDNKTYIFHLRKDVKFQTTDKFTPSRDFNADDVVFTFQHQMDKHSPYYRKEYTKQDAMGILTNIKEVKKIDDYTVKLVLKNPMPTLTSHLAMSRLAIVSKEYFEQMKNEGDLAYVYHHPVGTGAWIFDGAKEDISATFKVNENYWRTTVQPSFLHVHVIENRAELIKSTEKGICDITEIVSSEEKQKSGQYDHIKLLKQPLLGTLGMQINYKKFPQYNNPLVMQAISHAINRKVIAQTVYKGDSIPASGLIPEGMFGHMKDPEPYEYNLAKAKELMAQAGHKNGRGLPKLIYSVVAQTPTYRKLGLYMKKALKEIGISLELRTVPWGTYLDLIDNHTYGVSVINWTADIPDPDDFYSGMLGKVGSGNNYPYWKNKEYEQLRLKSQTVSDPDERLKIYTRISEIFNKHLPIIPINYSKPSIAINKKIHNYKIGPMNMIDGLTDITKDEK